MGDVIVPSRRGRTPLLVGVAVVVVLSLVAALALLGGTPGLPGPDVPATPSTAAAAAGAPGADDAGSLPDDRLAAPDGPTPPVAERAASTAAPGAAVPVEPSMAVGGSSPTSGPAAGPTAATPEAGTPAPGGGDTSSGVEGAAPTSPIQPPPVSPADPERPLVTATGAGPGRLPAVGTLPLGPSRIEPGTANRTSLDLVATYDVDLAIEWTTRKIAVTTRILVDNTSGGPIDRVELNTVAARLGGLQLDSVVVDDRPVTASVGDQTITVPFDGVLPAGRLARVDLTYRATLRTTTAGSDWMFSQAGGVAALYRWIPWISEPVAFDRPNHGDPFVTPVSPWIRVRVSADRPLVVATAGEETATEDGGRRRTFIAGNLRDFALTAAPDYAVSRTTVGSVTVQVYSRPGDPAAALRDEARRAIERMEPLLGPFPYPRLTVARSAGGFAMEAPGMIWIPPGAANLPYLVHHETAHQWFYGLVGSHQADEPYADEAAADFVTRHVLGLRRASRCATAALDRPIYEYSSACYYEVVYIQGGNFLDDLRSKVGSTAFWAGLRSYLETNRHGFGGTKELLDAIDGAAAAVDLRSTFKPRFARYY